MQKPKLKTILALCSAILFLTSARAEVLESAANGFVLEISVEVPSTPEQSYAQFLRIGEWWDGEHSWFGKAENFSLEPHVGGCFCEIDGDREAQHMRVSFVQPNKEMRLLGGLGPLQMMSVHGAMSWQFVATETGTKIIHRYTVSGYSRDGLDKLAAVVDQVQSIQVNRLATKLNGQPL